MKLTRLSLIGLMMVSLLGCGDKEDGKGDESPMPDMTSADSFNSPTLHGQLEFGGGNPAELNGRDFFHAWDFTLEGVAELSLMVQAPDDHFDTVMYLYRRDVGSSSWGSYIERNDDFEGNLWSGLQVNLVAGEYRVLVKGYKRSLLGAFGIRAECSGEGCPGVTPQCDDGNLCTSDSWDSYHGICVHLPKDCSDSDPCTQDSCIPSTGGCAYTFIPGCGAGECLFSFDDDSLFQGHLGCFGAQDAAHLSSIQAAQVVQGRSEDWGEELTLEEALDDNDDNEVCISRYEDTAGWSYLFYQYYLGDTAVGFFFADGDRRLAYIQDGDLTECMLKGPSGDCFLGRTAWEMSDHPDFELLEEREVTSAGLDSLSEIRKQQMLDGFARYHSGSIGLEQAIDQLTDENYVQMTDYITPNGRKLVVYDFNSGENQFGFVYALADEVQAKMGDGDIYDCVPGGAPVLACLFGDLLGDWLWPAEESDGSTLTAQTVGNISKISQAQLMAGAQVAYWEGQTPAEVVANTDDEEVYTHQVSIQDRNSGDDWSFVVFTAYLGDTLTGFIVAEAETVLATIEGSSYLSCDVKGPGGGCLLGDEIDDARDVLPGFSAESKSCNWTNYAQLLAPVQAAQFVAGFNQRHGLNHDLEGVFMFIEDGEMELVTITAPDGRKFSQFLYWDGPGQLGFVYQEGDSVLADISDGDIADCQLQVSTY